MEIKSLLRAAFFTDDAKRATSAIEQARARVTDHAKVEAFGLEVTVPKRPDEVWLRERVLRPLLQFCKATGALPPSCTGAFVTFFHHDRVYCVLGAEVLAWASAELQMEPEALTERYSVTGHNHVSSRIVGSAGSSSTSS